MCFLFKPFSSSWFPNLPHRKEGKNKGGGWRDGSGWRAVEKGGERWWREAGLGSKSQAATCYMAMRSAASSSVKWGCCGNMRKK